VECHLGTKGENAALTSHDKRVGDTRYAFGRQAYKAREKCAELSEVRGQRQNME